MNSRTAVDSPIASMSRGDLHGKLCVGLAACRWRAPFPSVVAAARDSECAAHGADREGHLLLGDEGEFHSLSFAKKVAAAFKMSRSCRSRLTSRRRSESSLFSAVVSASGGPFPESTSDCFSQFRSADSVRSRFSATCWMLRSPARARRTASALNSGVNFLRFRRAMNNSWRIVAPLIGLSTKLGEDQSVPPLPEYVLPLSCV